MKGLVIKDFQITFFNVKRLAFLALVALLMLISRPDGAYSFVVCYVTMIMAMQVMTTISYDEFEHSSTFLMTLPVSRKQYVYSKYIFATMTTLGGWLAAMVLSTFFLWNQIKENGLVEYYISSFAIFVVIMLMIFIMLPIQLKYGGENGRMVVWGFCVGIFAIYFIVNRLCKNLGYDMSTIIESGINTFFERRSIGEVVIIFVVFVLAVLFCSMKIGIKIIEKKQY